ncbi:TolC family protein [Sphingobacterium sp. SRCM116780]|uniref:TolC family protein n=1 Tax=Sphingobacterium sp. SRCM116780 TaxID=2907623 RepID=UPI001F281586|nr:TolC family protein [Sphingobacterium sp. SRCM116780]UIR54833.1 TolC family protein [Sphingobacterium sp. SRCM116780]
MRIILSYLLIGISCLCFFPALVHGQSVLSLKEALAIAEQQYPSLEAKQMQIRSAEQLVKGTMLERLPNFNIGIQQSYGTVNGITGPMSGLEGSVGSSGPTLTEQNWNAAFGALYVAGINWEFFTFGRNQQRTRVAKQELVRNRQDFEQALFEHKIKVAAAYLNLIASQQIAQSYEKNFLRADSLRALIIARVKSGLVAGVDSTFANAERSNARMLFTNAKNKEREQKNILTQLIGREDNNFSIVSDFIDHIPHILKDSLSDISNHPRLNYYRSLIAVGEEQTKLLKTQYFPRVSLLGLFQGRGSGFSSTYAVDQSAYSTNYWSGIEPTRANYLMGISINWNLTTPFRLSKQIAAQQYAVQAVQQEYKEAELSMKTQLRISDDRLDASMLNYHEAPIQVAAAREAFIQKSVLYKNGLTNMVEVMQVANTLIRAETDRDIANNNVWQALLLQAASKGDFSLFENQL